MDRNAINVEIIKQFCNTKFTRSNFETYPPNRASNTLNCCEQIIFSDTKTNSTVRKSLSKSWSVVHRTRYVRSNYDFNIASVLRIEILHFWVYELITESHRILRTSKRSSSSTDKFRYICLWWAWLASARNLRLVTLTSSCIGITRNNEVTLNAYNSGLQQARR